VACGHESGRAKAECPKLLKTETIDLKEWRRWTSIAFAQGRCATRLRYAPTPKILNLTAVSQLARSALCLGEKCHATLPIADPRITVRFMERAFVVLRSRGPAWDDSKPLEDQSDWAAHAAFMDELFEHRFVALVGPLEGTRDALLILRASAASEIVERLASDPWTTSGVLVTKQISPWQIRLGTLE
jgi:hypothetical protein